MNPISTPPMLTRDDALYSKSEACYRNNTSEVFLIEEPNDYQ
jgi:hypothetical protein